MTDMTSPEDGISHVFPSDPAWEESEEHALLQLRLGYPDLEYGVATQLLLELPPEELNLLHRFAPEYSNLLSMDPYLVDFVRGYHAVDPNRRWRGPQETVLEELQASHDYVALFKKYDRLPLLDWDFVYQGLTPCGAEISGWRAARTRQHKFAVDHMLDIIPIMQSAVQQPDLTDPFYQHLLLGTK